MDVPSYSFGSELMPGLSKMIEEMGELSQIIGKIQAVGHMGEHYNVRNLEKELVREMGDVRAAIAAFTEINGLSKEDVMQRESDKFLLFKRWHANVSAGREPYTDEDGVRRVPEHLWR